jgi:hypothetical protein
MWGVIANSRQINFWVYHTYVTHKGCGKRSLFGIGKLRKNNQARR